MTNDEYAARKIMKWPEKLGGWVTPDGFIDRCFWKPSENLSQLVQVMDALGATIETTEITDDCALEPHMTVDGVPTSDRSAFLEAIVKAHKESEE